MSRYNKGGWYGDSHRHYLAAKYGKAPRRYNAYTGTYVPSDLPLIAGDALGTAGAEAVSLIPVAVPALALAGGVVLAKKTKDKVAGKKSYKALMLKHGKDPDSQFDPEQLAKGVRVEMEHTNDPMIAKQIAKAHLKELPDYYTRLETVEAPAGKQMTVKGVPIVAEKVEKGRIYPVDPEDVAKELERQKPEDIRGLKGFEFVNPVGEQKDAWGQYVRSKKVVYVFSQPYKNGKIDGQDPKKIREHIKEYVLPHEIGHHVALRNGKTDKDLRVAEARADAHVVGMDPTDKDVKKLVRK